MTQALCAIVPANPGINRLWSDHKTNHRGYGGLGTAWHGQQQIWEHIAESEDPWPHFLTWESEWHVREGIKKLRHAPFVSWGNSLADLQVLELRQTYPAEATAGETSYEADIQFVVSAIRQAREYYAAAMTVSELTRPTLMYYSAVMLGQAAGVTLFGSDYVKAQKGHGLTAPNGGLGMDGTDTQWPTFVVWQAKGDFVPLYNATRWDRFHMLKPENAPWPKFHILECLRCIGIMGSHESLTKPMSLDRLLWSHLSQQSSILPASREHITKNPVFEVPRVTVLYMVLFWLGVMARYHPVSWQGLLTGQFEEGYFFRRALDEVPRQFVRAMQEVLPNPYLIQKPADNNKVTTLLEPQTLQKSYQLNANLIGEIPIP